MSEFYDFIIKGPKLDLGAYQEWSNQRDRVIEKDRVKVTCFVTISREFGCEGYDLSTKLIEKINKSTDSPWSLITRTMIDEMISGEDMPSDIVKNVSETRWSLKDWFIDALVPNYLQSPSTHVYKRMRNVILNTIGKGNCVILGSGSQIISSALDPAKFQGIHVRLTASHNWRLRRTEKLFDLNQEKAVDALHAKQGLRDNFISDFTGVDAADNALYTVIFNNARNTPDMMADVITHMLKLKGAL